MNATARKVWREGILPQLTDGQLAALSTALETDDPRLIQGSTTSPLPVPDNLDCHVQATCPLAFALWQGRRGATIREVESAFARLCAAADAALGLPRSVSHFAGWWDESDREHARLMLLAEVEIALLARRMMTPAA
jgi:hypothetical protein